MEMINDSVYAPQEKVLSNVNINETLDQSNIDANSEFLEETKSTTDDDLRTLSSKEVDMNNVKIREMIEDINNSKVIDDRYRSDLQEYERDINTALNNLKTTRNRESIENEMQILINGINRSTSFSLFNLQDLRNYELETADAINSLNNIRERNVIEQKINDMIIVINDSKVMDVQQLEDLLDYKRETAEAIKILEKSMSNKNAIDDFTNSVRRNKLIYIERIDPKLNYDLEIKKAISQIWKPKADEEFDTKVSHIVHEITQKDKKTTGDNNFCIRSGDTFYFKYDPNNTFKTEDDQSSIKNKPAVDILFSEFELNSQFSTSPIRPGRKKRSPSVPNLKIESHYVDRCSAIIKPPRQTIDHSENETRNLSDMNEMDLDKITFQDRDPKENRLETRSQNDVRFTSPEISFVLTDLGQRSPQYLDSRESINIMKMNDADNSSKKKPNITRKSNTFTKGDIYMNNIRQNAKLMKRSKSVKKLLRRTFSFNDLPKTSDNPPCMPNLLKRYKLRKKKSKGKLPTISEEIIQPHLKRSHTSESFASIFMSDFTDDDTHGSYLERCTSNFEPYESMNSLHFPVDSVMKRSSSHIEVIDICESIKQITEHPPIKTPRLKRRKSFNGMDIRNRQSAKQLDTDDSTFSLNPEAIRKAHELLSKSVGDKGIIVCKNPVPPKRTKSKLNLNNLYIEEISNSKMFQSFDSIFGSVDHSDLICPNTQELKSSQAELSVFYDDQMQSIENNLRGKIQFSGNKETISIDQKDNRDEFPDIIDAATKPIESNVIHEATSNIRTSTSTIDHFSSEFSDLIADLNDIIKFAPIDEATLFEDKNGLATANEIAGKQLKYYETDKEESPEKFYIPTILKELKDDHDESQTQLSSIDIETPKKLTNSIEKSIEVSKWNDSTSVIIESNDSYNELLASSKSRELLSADEIHDSDVSEDSVHVDLTDKVQKLIHSDLTSQLQSSEMNDSQAVLMESNDSPIELLLLNDDDRKSLENLSVRSSERDEASVPIDLSDNNVMLIRYDNISDLQSSRKNDSLEVLIESSNSHIVLLPVNDENLESLEILSANEIYDSEISEASASLNLIRNDVEIIRSDHTSDLQSSQKYDSQEVLIETKSDSHIELLPVNDDDLITLEKLSVNEIRGSEISEVSVPADVTDNFAKLTLSHPISVVLQSSQKNDSPSDLTDSNDSDIELLPLNGNDIYFEKLSINLVKETCFDHLSELQFPKKNDSQSVLIESNDRHTDLFALNDNDPDSMTKMSVDLTDINLNSQSSDNINESEAKFSEKNDSTSLMELNDKILNLNKLSENEINDSETDEVSVFVEATDNNAKKTSSDNTSDSKLKSSQRNNFPSVLIELLPVNDDDDDRKYLEKLSVNEVHDSKISEDSIPIDVTDNVVRLTGSDQTRQLQSSENNDSQNDLIESNNSQIELLPVNDENLKYLEILSANEIYDSEISDGSVPIDLTENSVKLINSDLTCELQSSERNDSQPVLIEFNDSHIELFSLNDGDLKYLDKMSVNEVNNSTILEVDLTDNVKSVTSDKTNESEIKHFEQRDFAAVTMGLNDSQIELTDLNDDVLDLVVEKVSVNDIYDSEIDEVPDLADNYVKLASSAHASEIKSTQNNDESPPDVIETNDSHLELLDLNDDDLNAVVKKLSLDEIHVSEADEVYVLVDLTDNNVTSPRSDEASVSNSCQKYDSPTVLIESNGSHINLLPFNYDDPKYLTKISVTEIHDSEVNEVSAPVDLPDNNVKFTSSHEISEIKSFREDVSSAVLTESNDNHLVLKNVSTSKLLDSQLSEDKIAELLSAGEFERSCNVTIPADLDSSAPLVDLKGSLNSYDIPDNDNSNYSSKQIEQDNYNLSCIQNDSLIELNEMTDIENFNNEHNANVIRAFHRQYMHDLKDIGIHVDDLSCQESEISSTEQLVNIKSLHSKISSSSLLEDLNESLHPSNLATEVDNSSLIFSEEELELLDLKKSVVACSKSRVFEFPYKDETKPTLSKDFMVDGEAFNKDCKDGTLNVKLKNLSEFYEKEILEQIRKLSGDYERCVSPYVKSQKALADDTTKNSDLSRTDGLVFEKFHDNIPKLCEQLKKETNSSVMVTDTNDKFHQASSETDISEIMQTTELKTFHSCSIVHDKNQKEGIDDGIVYDISYSDKIQESLLQSEKTIGHDFEKLAYDHVRYAETIENSMIISNSDDVEKLREFVKDIIESIIDESLQVRKQVTEVAEVREPDEFIAIETNTIVIPEELMTFNSLEEEKEAIEPHTIELRQSNSIELDVACPLSHEENCEYEHLDSSELQTTEFELIESRDIHHTVDKDEIDLERTSPFVLTTPLTSSTPPEKDENIDTTLECITSSVKLDIRHSDESNTIERSACKYENQSKFDVTKKSKIFHFPSKLTLKKLDELLYSDIADIPSPLPSPILTIRELYKAKDRKVIEVESPISKRRYFVSSVTDESTPPGSPFSTSPMNFNFFQRRMSGDKSKTCFEKGHGLMDDGKMTDDSLVLEDVMNSSIKSDNYNSIKENCCSAECRCAQHDLPTCDHRNVKIVAVREKRLTSLGQESPEISVRTWPERQERSEEFSTPSPVLIPYWISDNESDTDSHFYLPLRRDTPSPGPPHESIADDLKKIDSKPQNRREDDRTQRDCCVEVYPETLRQRQRNMAPSPNKVDIKNWEPLPINNNNGDESKCSKKLLPSVKALRNQFENGKASQRDASPPARDAMSSSTTSSNLGRTSSNSSTSSLAMSSLEVSSGFGSLTSSQTTLETSTPRDQQQQYDDEPVEPIFRQFQSVDQQLRDLTSKPPSTTTWDPIPLLKKLYYVPETPKIQEQKTNYINIDGYLEKLPSGRKKATFWNAWKRRYFVAKDGVLYYYQNEISEKPNMKLPLMGGKVEIMEPNMVSVDDGEKEIRGASMLGIDDGKGHYVVVRCISRQEAEKWKKALDTHVADDFSAQFVNPWPQPTNPSLLRDTLVVDIGSCSVRAGVLASQPTLPQLFFPSIMATKRDTRKQILGMEALSLEARTGSVLTFPVRPSHKISKFSVDLNAISSLLQKTFTDLNVDPRNYNLQLSVPRVLNPYTQAELLKILFEKFEIKSVNLTHQSILALYAYNATSGIVVDIGERIDVVPVIDGYIVDGGVSRVPYGGHRIMEHLRHFLFQRNLSLVNEVDSYVIREVMETVCYSAQHYNTEKSRCNSDPESFDKTVDMTDYFPDQSQFEAFRSITLDYGRFQATEGIFNPDAWGLDHPGLHKLVHKAIQECSMDIRKEMSRSIFLVGGVSQLPGIAERLSSEIDNLTPPAIRPKVHASPYRYHGSYLGACVLAESPAFHQSKITKEEWQKQGNAALRKWAL